MAKDIRGKKSQFSAVGSTFGGGGGGGRTKPGLASIGAVAIETTNASTLGAGKIDTDKIYDTHAKIKEIVNKYIDVNERVNDTVKKVKANWVGKGSTEFECQYEQLIGKIDDFGDTLVDIYEALVKAEAEYQLADEAMQKEMTKTS